MFSKALALLSQTGQVHLGLQRHEERARVGDLQIKPQTWERKQKTYDVFYTKPMPADILVNSIRKINNNLMICV